MINSNVAPTSNATTRNSKDLATPANGDNILKTKNIQHNNKTKSSNMTSTSGNRARVQQERDDRESLVLWKRPKTTLLYAFLELCNLCQHYGQK